MKSILFIALLWMGLGLFGQTIQMNALDPLLGEKWKGLLTYLDYSSEKKVIIPVELRVIKLDKAVYQFVYTYPDEPEANQKSKIKIGKEGRTIAKHKIVDVARKIDGTLIILAKSKGKDNNQKAELSFGYTIGPNHLNIIKKVKYEGTDELFVRNSYRFTRKNPEENQR